MGKLLMQVSYKELQIIKHGLQHYTQRENATESDTRQEHELLLKVTKKVDDFKSTMRIK